MRIAGDPLRTPVVYATVDGATLRLPRGTRLVHGLHAIQLPPETSVRDLRLAPELLAQGLDLANYGAQYGDLVYVRNLTGLVLDVDVLGTAVVETLAAPPPVEDAPPGDAQPRATRRGPKAA